MRIEATGPRPAAGLGEDDLFVAPRGYDEPSAEGKSFGQLLTEAVGDVNTLQNNAGQMVQRFATGERIDVHQVMIAIEQASTALALTTQVRNKLVDAYQEIMRTSV